MKIGPVTNQQHWRTCETCGRRVNVLESHRHKVGPFEVVVDPAIPNDRIHCQYGEQIVGRIVNVRV